MNQRPLTNPRGEYETLLDPIARYRVTLSGPDKSGRWEWYAQGFADAVLLLKHAPEYLLALANEEMAFWGSDYPEHRDAVLGIPQRFPISHAQEPRMGEGKVR